MYTVLALILIQCFSLCSMGQQLQEVTNRKEVKAPPRILFSKKLDPVIVVEEIVSPKSLGLQLVALCKGGTSIKAMGIPFITESIERGADVNVCDNFGSALMWLAYHGFDDAVKKLLEHGARLDCVSKRGFTPLHAAAEAGNLSTLRLLMAQDPTKSYLNRQTDFCSSTALHLAAQNGHNLVVSYLIQQGALLELVDTYGRTPLHLACWKRQATAAFLLLEAGAHKNALANRRITPLAAAKHGGNEYIILELKRIGALEFINEVEEL